jgi:predicted PurR-regulated permease PerM
MENVEALLLAIVGDAGKQFAGYDVKQTALDATLRFGKLLQYCVQGQLEAFVRLVSRAIADGTSAAYKAMLAFLFSTLVIWDLPELTKGIRSLKESRLAFAYNELAPKVITLGSLIGRSFEVTAIIALVNCVLTTSGLGLLGVSGLGFFSVLTFVASFIPVAGIFIATLPPLLVALAESGVGKCVQILAMVTGVHAVESYLLYPQIYAFTLKMHPLIILSALAVAEHFFGVKGLFLAIPITLYLINEILFDGSRKKRTTTSPPHLG